jgi:hypothetical protein
LILNFIDGCDRRTVCFEYFLCFTVELTDPEGIVEKGIKCDESIEARDCPRIEISNKEDGFAMDGTI